MLTFNAFDSYISAEPDYLPLIATTGVLFLEANYITQLYLHNHSSCPQQVSFINRDCLSTSPPLSPLHDMDIYSYHEGEEILERGKAPLLLHSPFP